MKQINKKFDRESFEKEIIKIINTFSENGNQFTNAEIVASLTAIFIMTLQQSIKDKEAAKYLFNRIIDEAFE